MNEETVVTEPTTEPATPKQENNELQAMIAKLNEVGITSVEQLENKVTAASESGRLANMVGSLRKEIAELKTPKPAPHAEYGEDGVDIESVISGAVDKALDKREEKQKKVQSARVVEAQAIRSDENYPVVAEKFEKFMVTPKARGLLENGYTPTVIFNKMVNYELRNMLVTMKNGFEGVAGDPSKTLVPHMESGQVSQPVTTAADEKKTKIKTIRENWAGNDDDITKALNALLPSGTLPMPGR